MKKKKSKIKIIIIKKANTNAHLQTDWDIPLKNHHYTILHI